MGRWMEMRQQAMVSYSTAVGRSKSVQESLAKTHDKWGQACNVVPLFPHDYF